MTTQEIRSEIQKLLASGQRGAKVRKQVANLEWELDRLTATSAVNARRTEMGLAPWPDRAA